MSADARSESSIATTEVDADTPEVEADTSEEATTVKDEPGASSTPGDGEMSPFSRCLELWNMPILSPQVPVEPAPRLPVPVEPEPQRPTAVSLEERWDAARVAARGLPIAFYFVPDEDLEGSIPPDADAFYIGATTDPKWRWIGGESERGFMQGHSRNWNALHVLHLSESESSRSQEKRLIHHCMNQYPSRCHNRTPDARWQGRGEPNFLYVAWR